MEDREEFLDQEERDPLDPEEIEGSLDQQEKRAETFDQRGGRKRSGRKLGSFWTRKKVLGRQSSPRDQRAEFVGTSSWDPVPRLPERDSQGGGQGGVKVEIIRAVYPRGELSGSLVSGVLDLLRRYKGRTSSFTAPSCKV